MRKRNLFLAIFMLAAFMVMVLPSYSASLVTNLGIPNSSGVGPLQIDSDRVITIAADAGIKYAYEATATSDTLTAADSGKTFILDPLVDDVTFTLPDADVGLNFIFNASDGSGKFILEPQSTDYFRGVVNSAAGNTFSTGDSVISPGNTGDSISIFCGEDLYWNVLYKIGTFVDNN